MAANSDLALAEAVHIGKACGSEIAIVHVIDNTYLRCDPLLFAPDDLRKALREDGEALLKAARERVEAERIPCATRLRDEPAAIGEISTVVEQAAQECGAELLVIGTHGRHGIRRILLGSVAEALVGHSRLPVLLVRR
ncbi:universal stress protein [Cupriavidus sp. DF5525]|uniref:universal stress protein n=1 Tax=Cupriavidus sp. DF5525 TaxID=3160989 RepID=UPI0003B0F219|nr:universal stress protein UspA [Ralstonia pickettii DTP0602]